MSTESNTNAKYKCNHSNFSFGEQLAKLGSRIWRSLSVTFITLTSHDSFGKAFSLKPFWQRDNSYVT